MSSSATTITTKVRVIDVSLGTKDKDKDKDKDKNKDKPTSPPPPPPPSSVSTTLVQADGTQIWYLGTASEEPYAGRVPTNLLHRGDDQPAVIRSNGQREWWFYGQMHREGDQPAFEDQNNKTYAWYQQGQLHREGGKPAIITPVQQYWFLYGDMIYGGRHITSLPSNISQQPQLQPQPRQRPHRVKKVKTDPVSDTTNINHPVERSSARGARSSPVSENQTQMWSHPLFSSEEMSPSVGPLLEDLDTPMDMVPPPRFLGDEIEMGCFNAFELPQK